MTKRITKQLNSFKYKGEPVKITLGTLVLTCFCTLLLIVSTFTQIGIISPIELIQIISGSNYADYIESYKYIPQIPMVFFITSLLGRKFGILSICIYIILGMFFPVFALGGGISYIFEFGFGYILAFIPAIIFTGTILKVKTDFLRIVLMSVLGVATIHLSGVLYILFISALSHVGMDMALSWILSQSSVQILYDILFSIVGLYLGRFAKKIFWIIMC